MYMAKIILIMTIFYSCTKCVSLNGYSTKMTDREFNLPHEAAYFYKEVPVSQVHGFELKHYPKPPTSTPQHFHSIYPESNRHYPVVTSHPRHLVYHSKPTYHHSQLSSSPHVVTQSSASSLPQMHDVDINHSPYYEPSYQLDQQHRNYLQQFNQYTPQPQMNSFKPSPVDYGFKPAPLPKLQTPALSAYDHTLLNIPQPFGYVRNYVDLLKKRQKQHFGDDSSEGPQYLSGGTYHHNDGDNNNEDENDDDNANVDNVSDGDEDDNIQEHEQSDEIDYFKQREQEIGSQNYATKQNSHETPQLYRVTEDYENDVGSDEEADYHNNDNNEDDDQQDANTGYGARYPNLNKVQENKYRNDQNNNDDEQEYDEDEDETKNHETRNTSPIRVYSQVRHLEKKSRKPLKRPVYEPNLREKLSQEKRHLVYKEEGYEDKEYDHAGHEKDSISTEESALKKGKKLRQNEKNRKKSRVRIERSATYFERNKNSSPRGNKKYNYTTLKGIDLINHINELLVNSSVYLPDDSSEKATSKRQLKATKDHDTSESEQKSQYRHIFTTTPKQIIEKNFKNVSFRRPPKSIYKTKPKIDCEEDDFDFDEDDFDGTTKKRGGQLGIKLDCLKAKFFGNDPFNEPFFEDDLVTTSTPSIPSSNVGKKRQVISRGKNTNVSKVVYDDIMNNIKKSQNNAGTDVILGRISPLKKKPLDSAPQENKSALSFKVTTVSPLLFSTTEFNIKNFFNNKHEKAPPTFDINDYYPKPSFEFTTRLIPTVFRTTPTYSPPISSTPFPFRSVHAKPLHTINSQLTSQNSYHQTLSRPLQYVPNNNIDQQSAQSSKPAFVNSHLNTKIVPIIIRTTARPMRILVHRVIGK